jgi:hypothetical protein
MTDDLPKIAFWMGKPVTDYSKDQLVEIVAVLGRQLEHERKRHRIMFDCLLDPFGKSN